MLRLGCIERKEKGRTKGAERPKRAMPILGPLSQQRNFFCYKDSLALCRDRVFRVMTGFLDHVHNPT